ncbi:MAG: hypothetical protein HRT69_17825 [Flavobacteriaceae bacterium]|nr:hypothetical protein [Flavobacteriaceae bacterium]
MAKQAAVEAKQEGEFTLKGKNIPKRKVKDLGKTSKEPVKMEIKKPVEEKVETPKIDLTKKEDNAVQERKTEEIPVGDKPETSREVDKEVRVSDTNDKEDSPLQVIEEITEEVKPKEQVKEKPQLIETPKLPENVEKLVTFMNETGGTVEDYVELNKDYSKLSNDQLLHEYLRKTKPHLDKEDIDLIMEDYQYEEDIDDPKEIRKKKLAYKEAVASAKKDLEVRKTKYYAEIKNRPGVTQEQQKAMDFFNRYNKQQEEIKLSQADFKERTNQILNNEFEGFEYNVGDKKFRYKIKDPVTIAEKQSDINNFVSRFLDKEGKIIDTAGYHKALYAAMNADKLASHFYEQGKADGVQDMIKQSKNPSTDAPRQVASGDVYVGGFKVKAISGADSSKLKIKKRTFNN